MLWERTYLSLFFFYLLHKTLKIHKMVIFVIGCFTVLIAITLAIMWWSREEAKQLEKSKRVILYNRRTRQIKEVALTEYVASKSWEKIITTFDSMFDGFMRYLKDHHMINNINSPKYNGSPSEGSYTLTLEFRKFLHEKA